ncbi:MAG: MYXO-CTERM sorting domain-containing protein [Bradymonadaceae bacterium]
MFAALAQAASAQTKFNPKTGGQVVSQVVMLDANGDRLNSKSKIIGQLGVEQCKDQMGKRIDFRYQINQNLNKVPFFQQVHVLEFDAQSRLEGSCTQEGEQDACQQLFADNENVLMSPKPNESRVLQEKTIEISVDFETLLKQFDDEAEACKFVTADNPQSYVPRSGHTDAGDVGPADADAAGMADTGDTGGDGTVTGTDRIYSVRLFLKTRRPNVIGNNNGESHQVDAPLLLDRTRPPKPKNVLAGATENVLKVAFDPPSGASDSDIEDYFVFFSTQQFSTSTDPEVLADRKAVKRRPLSGVSSSDDGGQKTGKVTGIDQSAGSQLYVAVASRDDADNFSKLTQTERNTIPVNQSIDFWEKYKSAGGVEPGGCACSTSTDQLPTSLLAILIGLGGLAFVRRRR